jgi:serine/threonine-protein kinase
MASGDAGVIVEGVLGPGSRVDGYLIEEEIGQGGMATVYRVSLPELRAEAAMKVPHLGLAAEWLEQFRHEAELLFNLSNQHIVKPRAFGRLSDGRPWLVMELHRGNTLAQELEKRPGGVGVSEALRYAIQLCRGLGAAHAAGIIHRDLKPENILFDAKETVTVSDKEVPTLRLSDFGLASRVGEAFTPAGTVDYLSPEQAQQRPPDGRADLFSLGAVLYELLSGQLPWERQQDGDTEERIKARLVARIANEGTRLELVAGDVPREVADVVHKLLALDPARRYQTADEARAALEVKLKQFENRTERTHANVSLEELRGASQRNVSTDLMLPPVIAAAARRRRWGAVVLLAVLAVLAAGAWWLWPGPGESQPTALGPELASPQVTPPVVEPGVDAGALAVALPEPERLTPLEPLVAVPAKVQQPKAQSTVRIETAPPCTFDDRFRDYARAAAAELRSISGGGPRFDKLEDEVGAALVDRDCKRVNWGLAQMRRVAGVPEDE